MHYAQWSRLCYLLVQLEKLHCHIALKLLPRPAGKHPQPGDHHRVQDLEIQGYGRHISGGQRWRVSHFHYFYLCLLPCRWDRKGVGESESYWTSIHIYYNSNMLTISFLWWRLGDLGRESVHRRRHTALKLHHQHFEKLVLGTAVFKASFHSSVWFLN